MVEKANRITATVSTYGNHGNTDAKAFEVATTPSEVLTPYSIILPSPLQIIITRAVMVQTTTVSINGSSKATKPSDAGYFVLTAEWAIAAEPTPASLEKAALWKPTIKTPNIPPVMPLA